MMAWVFVNWWQVLIAIWLGGVLNELIVSVLKNRLAWDLKSAPLAHRIGIWVGPFVWPLHLLVVLVTHKTGNGAVVMAGEHGFTVQRGLDARRLLEDLTAEFSVEPPKKHVLMLGEKKGELAVCIARPDGLLRRLQLTHEDQALDHNLLVDDICSCVDALDAEQVEQ